MNRREPRPRILANSSRELTFHRKRPRILANLLANSRGTFANLLANSSRTLANPCELAANSRESAAYSRMGTVMSVMCSVLVTEVICFLIGLRARGRSIDFAPERRRSHGPADRRGAHCLGLHTKSSQSTGARIKVLNWVAVDIQCLLPSWAEADQRKPLRQCGAPYKRFAISIWYRWIKDAAPPVVIIRQDACLAPFRSQAPCKKTLGIPGSTEHQVAIWSENWRK